MGVYIDWPDRLSIGKAARLINDHHAIEFEGGAFADVPEGYMLVAVAENREGDATMSLVGADGSVVPVAQSHNFDAACVVYDEDEWHRAHVPGRAAHCPLALRAAPRGREAGARPRAEDRPMKGRQTIYVCPDDACRFHAMEPGKCRSHPYPCRAMGPELVPLLVTPVSEKPTTYDRHTECRMIVVVGDWHGLDPIVVGAVEETSYDGHLEARTWNDVRRRMLTESGLDDVPEDSLREVLVTAWIPFLWQPLDLDASTVEPLDPGDSGESA